MNTRSKLIAAVLGFVVAASAMGDASARTFTKTVKTHAIAATSAKVIVRKAHRPLLATRVVKHVRIVHRAPVLGFKKVVNVTKRPLLSKQVFAHRTIVKKTVIR